MLDMRNQKIIPVKRVFEAAGVSSEKGRHRIDELARLGIISPRKTPTGRCFLSFEDVEKFVCEL